MKTEAQHIIDHMSPRELSDARRMGIKLNELQNHRADEHERLERGYPTHNGVPILSNPDRLNRRPA